MLLQPFLLRGAALLLLLVLAGCGGAFGCTSAGPRGPATTASGPVTVTLDHSIYAPADEIQVTVSNRADAPIDAFWHMARNCLPFYVQEQVNGEWPAKGTLYCFNPEQIRGDAGPSSYQDIYIARGGFYPYNIASQDKDAYGFGRMPGVYRLAAPYALLGNYNLPVQYGIAISEPFRICACATCS
jgi:hypothetical protein